MSKEYLEAIERIKNKFINFFHEDNPDVECVEDALQRIEAIDNANPSGALKSLEVLEKIISPLLEPILAEYEDDLSDKITANYFALKQALLKAQENEKVLEIIKNKNVWVARLKGLIKKYNDLDALRIYNANMPSIDYQLTQQEFNSLKEWLGNE